MREARQHVGEILDGVDVEEGAAAQRLEHDGGPLGARVTDREEKILPRQRRADVEPLDRAVVDGG